MIVIVIVIMIVIMIMIKWFIDISHNEEFHYIYSNGLLLHPDAGAGIQLLKYFTIIIIIIYNLYRGKAPVTGSDFQGGPLRVKIKYTKAKNIQYN